MAVGVEGKPNTKYPVQHPVYSFYLIILKLDLPLRIELQTGFLVDSFLNMNGQSGIISHLRKAYNMRETQITKQEMGVI